MAHGRPAGRQGRFVYHSDTPKNSTLDELPSQSVFSLHGAEEVHHVLQNPVMHTKKLSLQKSQDGATKPMVAVHMFNLPSEKPAKESETCNPRSGRPDGRPVPSPPDMPPSPHVVRQESARRRRFMGQKPPSSKRRSSRDLTSSKETDDPRPMTLERRRSSLSKYDILPAIGGYPQSPPGVCNSKPHGNKSNRSAAAAEGSSIERDKMDSVITKHMNLSSFNDSLTAASSRPSGSPDNVMAKRMPQGSLKDHSMWQGTDETSFTSHHPSQPCEPLSHPILLTEMGMYRTTSALSYYGMSRVVEPNRDEILIGVKIPTDGTRHKNYFNSDDQLRCIVLYAEEVSGKNFSDYVIVVPSLKQRYTDLSQTIRDAGLESKSVVHLEEMD